MNTTTIGRGIAAATIAVLGFAVSACGADFAAPAQDISVDRSSDTDYRPSTGDHKVPPDSRP
jgi:hypothetical protein